MDDIVCFIGQKAFIDRDGKLLVLHDPQMGWDLPGGKVQVVDRDLPSALKREVMEEAGLSISIGQPFYTWLFTIPADSGHRSAGKQIFCVGYKCKYVSGQIKLSHEHDSFCWITKSNYQEYISAGFTAALKTYFS